MAQGRYNLGLIGIAGLFSADTKDPLPDYWESDEKQKTTDAEKAAAKERTKLAMRQYFLGNDG